MGADLYIVERMKEQDVLDARAEFDHFAQLRDSVKEDSSEEYKYYDHRVHEAYNKMYPEDGYFRDSYNDWSLFWKLGLSWWQDVGKLIKFHNPFDENTETHKNEDWDLDSGGIEELLSLVYDVEWVEEFESLSDEEKKYFIEKREKFIQFCQNAIKNNWHMSLSI